MKRPNELDKISWPWTPEDFTPEPQSSRWRRFLQDTQRGDIMRFISSWRRIIRTARAEAQSQKKKSGR